jgi:thiol-disulfide isomerase/thioredoxin
MFLFIVVFSYTFLKVSAMPSRFALLFLAALPLAGCDSSPPAGSNPPSHATPPPAHDGQPAAGTDSDSVGAIEKFRDDPYANLNSYPFDFALTSVSGEKVAMSDFAGKVLVVDIWATWCGPCRAEVPHFVELQEQYKEAGLALVGINYEGSETVEEDIAEIKKFTDEIPVNYPLLLGDDATQMQVPDFSGYPTTLFIDRAGKVRLTLLGARDKSTLEQIVTSLLNEPAPSSP